MFLLPSKSTDVHKKGGEVRKAEWGVQGLSSCWGGYLWERIRVNATGWF